MAQWWMSVVATCESVPVCVSAPPSSEVRPVDNEVPASERPVWSGVVDVPAVTSVACETSGVLTGATVA